MILSILGGVVVVPPLVFLTFLFLWPGVLMRTYNWLWRVRLGLVVRFSQCGRYRFCYSSRGSPGAGPSILLLHGFSATKDMWLPVVKFLPRDQHVICVDMPGHEGTSRTGPEDYSIEGQVARIHQFVQSVSLAQRPFHLVGTSMGGNVAGVYAARHPTDLSSLTLICPAGLVYPTDSKFIVRLRELEESRQREVSTPPSTPPSPPPSTPPSPPPSIPLIPSSVSELEEMLGLCCHAPLKLPRPVLRGLLANRIPNNDFYREVFMEIVGEGSRSSLQDVLSLLSCPVQVIWGCEDQVLDVSGASVLQAALQRCRVDLLDNCGHSVALERPRKTATLITDFLSQQEVTRQEVSAEDTKKNS